MMPGRRNVIILDTCILIFDALTPERLNSKALRAIEEGEQNGRLACADISLWEIAMLIGKGRLDPGTDCGTFIDLVLAARGIRTIPVTPEIACLSVNHPGFAHYDPADRLIAATAINARGSLVTCDERLLGLKGLKTIW
jgi:PIN domain nuclease of toxin-antitoxin system